jgi:hypothetical protein
MTVPFTVHYILFQIITMPYYQATYMIGDYEKVHSKCTIYHGCTLVGLPGAKNVCQLHTIYLLPLGVLLSVYFWCNHVKVVSPKGDATWQIHSTMARLDYLMVLPFSLIFDLSHKLGYFSLHIRCEIERSWSAGTSLLRLKTPLW